jgi:hypothetical protein
MVLTEAAVRGMVAAWYSALDRHVPLDEAQRYLAAEGLEMRFPEVTSKGLDGFADWYKAVTHRFFNEVHTVTSVTLTSLTAERAELNVVVNWQASIWNPPEATSQWLGFDAYQTWEVVAGPADLPQIRTYVVDALEPMPGSASL